MSYKLLVGWLNPYLIPFVEKRLSSPYGQFIIHKTCDNLWLSAIFCLFLSSRLSKEPHCYRDWYIYVIVVDRTNWLDGWELLLVHPAHLQLTHKAVVWIYGKCTLIPGLFRCPNCSSMRVLLVASEKCNGTQLLSNYTFVHLDFEFVTHNKEVHKRLYYNLSNPMSSVCGTNG